MINDFPGRQVSGGGRRGDRVTASRADVRSLHRRATILSNVYSGGPATFELSVKM